MITPEKNTNPAKGILLVIIAFLGFSIMSAFIKECSGRGLSTQQIMFFQNLVALILILPWILHDRQSLRPQNTLLVLGRTIIGLLSMYFYFLAVRFIPLVDATLLQSTTPIFIPIIALFVFRKKLTPKTLAIMTAGFIGVAMVLHPDKGALNPEGDLIALFSGFLSALSTVFIKLLNDKEEAIKIVMFYYLAISTIIMGLCSIPTWANPHGMLWLFLVASGVLYALFQMLLILSVKYASTTTISPFIYLAVVFSGIIDWVIWNMVPNTLTICGSLLVIASAIISTVHLKKHQFPIHLFHHSKHTKQTG